MELLRTTNSIVKIVILDISILAAIYTIPALSHILPFPLFLIDPMRILLLTGYVLSKNKNNAYLLAFSIPVFSMLTTGHPIFPKSLLISTELIVNVLLLGAFLDKINIKTVYALIMSIFFSKTVYYLLKFVFIFIGAIEGKLIATSLFIQSLTVITISVVFSFLLKSKSTLEK